MKAEATLQILADFYPSIFPTRMHALRNLFVITGTGWEWKNGQLVGGFNDSPYWSRYILREKIDKAEFRFEKTWYEERERYKNIYGSYEDKRMPYEYRFNWFNASIYSNLANVPEDIQDDWKALVDECKSLLLEAGFYIAQV